MDHLSRNKRSLNMSLIRSEDTTPERVVRSVLHRMGYRFGLHKKDLPGRPDIVLTKHRILIFVHGCYWHQHKGCKRAFKPSTNKKFWLEKFNKNVIRDKLNRLELRRDGWEVITVWECQTVKIDKLAQHLRKKLNGT